MARKPRTSLTAKQFHVLNVFSDGRAYAANDWGSWYPMNADQVRNIMRSLGNRSLIDVAGFEGRSRTYSITAAGHETLEANAALHGGDEDV